MPVPAWKYCVGCKPKEKPKKYMEEPTVEELANQEYYQEIWNYVHTKEDF